MSEFFLQNILWVYNNLAFQNLGLAILEIGVLSRLVFWPFTKQQAHNSRKMNDLQPQLKVLKDKHKNNQQAFATAQMELFKEHGVNPMGGCLPGIVQFVILFALIGAMNHILTMNLKTVFFILDMAKPDAYLVSGIPFAIPGVLVILASLTQYIQTKMMLAPSKPSGEERLPHSATASRGEKKDGDFGSEFAEAQKSMVWMFPLMFLFLGSQWPSGLALYWTVSSIISIFQQYRVSGLGGLQEDVVKLRGLWQKRTT